MNVATKALESIKSLLPSVGETTTKVRDAIRTLRQQMTALKKQRDELLASPLSQTDVEKLLHAQIDKEADAYRDMAAKDLSNALYTTTLGIGGEVRKPKHKGSAVGQMVDGMEVFNGSMLGGIRDARPGRAWPLDGGQHPINQTAAAFFFRDEMKRGASEIVAALKYPFADAPPFAQVKEKLAVLDAELSELAAAHEEIQRHAVTLGIVLPGYDDEAAGDDAGSAEFDPTGWTAGEVGGDGDDGYVAVYYRWPDSSLGDTPALDGRYVMRYDVRTGVKDVFSWENLRESQQLSLGVPRGLEHSDQFRSLRNKLPR